VSQHPCAIAASPLKPRLYLISDERKARTPTRGSHSSSGKKIDYGGLVVVPYTWPIFAFQSRDIVGQSVTMRVIREGPLEARRLDSWKEIASFFGRDERTVKRWEKEKGLPVHRMPENTGARVFAFTDELSRWMNNPDSNLKPLREPAAGQPAELTIEEAATAPARSGRQWIYIAAGFAVLVGIALLIAYWGKYSVTHRETTATGHNAALSEPHTAHTANIDPQAHELYLTGQYYWDKRTPADLNKAVGYFNQAIGRDPKYAKAYVGLANCYSLLREFAAMPSEDAFPRALAAARRAVELDDTSAEAHNALALVTFYWNWDAAGAEREFRRAIQLDPNYATAHHWYATFLMVLGRSSEALEQIELAQQLDPVSTPVLADKGLILYHKGDKDQAISLLKQLAVSQPAFFSTHQYLSAIYLDEGDAPNYLMEAGKAAALSHNAGEAALVQEADKGYRSGGEQGMLQSILLVQKKNFEQGSIPAFAVAEAYARLKDGKEALRYLETSFHRHEVAFLTMRVHEPFLFLHSDPAFRQLVERAGLPPLL
jgi:tetratricopeptide (TPR) repeat protein